MKYVKALGLLAATAAALMAFAGAASATLTAPTGAYLNGTVVATSTNSHFTGTVKIACNHGEIVGSNSSGGTKLTLSVLTLASCNLDTVTVLKKGVLVVAEGAGAVKSSGAEITVLTHKTIFGFPITSHCIYGTENTSVGTITDSHRSAPDAVIHINGEIPRIKTDSACGEDPAIWTGTYTVYIPSYLYVD